MSVQALLLCEDQMHAQFLQGLCKRLGLRPYVEPMPRGRGDASAWVRGRYAELLLEWRRLAASRTVVLMVMTDGDSPAKRRMAARTREEQGAPARQLGEKVAFFIPTWSIETWALFLHEGLAVSEDEPTKQRTDLNPLLAHPERGTLSSPALRRILDAFFERRVHAKLPSLVDGHRELDRVR